MSGRVCKRKPQQPDPLLVLAGKMAGAARAVVGGQGVNFYVAPANVDSGVQALALGGEENRQRAT